MLNLFKRFLFFKQALTEEDIAQFSLQIHNICDSVQAKNLTLVSNTVESPSGHNNHALVKAAVHFVKECLWVFNGNYAKADYFKEFTNYINEVEKKFGQQNYDPDVTGCGTITDISNSIKKSQLNEIQ
jgi:hypothetical protein